MGKRVIKFTLNGVERDEYVQDNMTMVDFLRKQMNLTGTKRGCEEGECGACTILLDGRAVASCMMLAVEADGHEIVTIEGVKKDGVLHPVQKAFIDKWALQCGFCTPGMIMSALSLLSENPHPTEHEIREGISGNLCRCTGYAKIVEAIDAAAKVMAKEVAE
ncbi:MAG: (2Fe-2S)-binding protein [Clostridiales bacterium]|nr:(2Fe-2S)-binding protein [Clostridiales bacterium]MDD7035447.1 (2Fe-2S)-binding protein [Bacillota bacterium]MDY2919970.1 (2Fe-2S)-binding protein [Lentihominibacter sp.]